MALELSVVQVSLASYRVSEYRNFREAEIRPYSFFAFFGGCIVSARYTKVLVIIGTGYRFSLQYVKKVRLKILSFRLFLLYVILQFYYKYLTTNYLTTYSRLCVSNSLVVWKISICFKQKCFKQKLSVTFNTWCPFFKMNGLRVGNMFLQREVNILLLWI